jgi:hypothetical protein
MADCYIPFETAENKKRILQKGNYLLKSTCCNVNSCERLQTHIQDTRYKCNDIFRSAHRDSLDEKGNMLGHTICSELLNKDNKVTNCIANFTNRDNKRGGTKKRNLIKKRVSRKNKKPKKYTNRRQKKYTNRRQKKY